MAKRPPIPDKLATEVMFASDRTCCVCRIEKHKCQIHHIDENPGNNAFDNLAVICVYCHIDTHSKIPFVRGLTPDLIRKYNSSWREIVGHRLSPAAANSDSMELAAEALLEATLDCHGWKIQFMVIAKPDLFGGREGQYVDVWDRFAEEWVPKYTEDTYQKFLPLFTKDLLRVQGRFDRLIQLFPDVLPPDFRANLVRANRQLNVECTAYLYLKSLVGEAIERESYFNQRFVGVIRVLREISRDADARRESATSLDQI